MIEQDIKVLKPVEFDIQNRGASTGVMASVRNAFYAVIAASVAVIVLTAIAGTGDVSAAALKPMVCGSSITDAWALCS